MTTVADSPNARQVVVVGAPNRGTAKLPLSQGTALTFAVGGMAGFGAGVSDDIFALLQDPSYGKRKILRGVVVDEGTRVVPRRDFRALIAGTSLNSILVDGPIEPFAAASRMARIRALAPLSYRDWAGVLGVSHSAVKQWADGPEPARDELDRVLAALSEASRYHADLPSWLTSPLPGMAKRPLDLLSEGRWRAFRGAIRTREAPTVALPPEDLARRREKQASWAVAEPPIVVDDA
jgi:hypothetical protein